MDWTDRHCGPVVRRRQSGYTCAMPTALSPIESEFATPEEAEAYERWFRVKVQESLDDPRPSVPHDQVMAEMRDLLAKKKAEKREVG